MNPLAIKASISAIIVFGAFYWGYKAGSLSGEADVSALEKNIALERLAMRELLNREVADNDLLKDQIRAQGIENQKVVDDARRNLAPVRVRLPAAMCADYGSPDSAAGSETTSAGTGVLSEPAGGEAGNAQLAMDEFIAGLKADAEAADGVVLMCKPVMDWAKVQ